MNWNTLTDVSQLENIKEESFKNPVLILKHSTTCSISATALNRLERNWKQDKVGDLKPYYFGQKNLQIQWDPGLEDKRFPELKTGMR